MLVSLYQSLQCLFPQNSLSYNYFTNQCLQCLFVSSIIFHVLVYYRLRPMHTYACTLFIFVPQSLLCFFLLIILYFIYFFSLYLAFLLSSIYTMLSSVHQSISCFCLLNNYFPFFLPSPIKVLAVSSFRDFIAVRCVVITRTTTEKTRSHLSQSHSAASASHDDDDNISSSCDPQRPTVPAAEATCGNHDVDSGSRHATSPTAMSVNLSSTLVLELMVMTMIAEGAARWRQSAVRNEVE